MRSAKRNLRPFGPVELDDILLLIALIIAIAIGWWLGRRESGRRSDGLARMPDDYLRGLNHLLREQPDEAIEAFSKALDVNSGAVETHLALGRLFRVRGQVDQATAVHQNLLARSDLPAAVSSQVRFELANDYMVAGLLDRAERLLKELSVESGEIKPRSLELLMEVYQREKEWELAIEVGLDLLPLVGNRIGPVLAHFCCEVAVEQLDRGEFNRARRQVKQALRYDENCVRASLLKGHLETQTGHFREAIKAFQRVKDQDPAYLPESIPKLAECYRELGKEKELEKFLLSCLEENPSVTVAFSVADLLYGAPGMEAQAHDFIAGQLLKRPSLRGVQRLIELLAEQATSADRAPLQDLRNLTGQLLESKPVYQCSHCGYAGKQLSWQCPGCSQWGKIKPIYGIEGE